MAYDPVRISAAEARLICQDLDAVRAARHDGRDESTPLADRLGNEAHLVAAQHIVRGYRTEGALLSGELVAVLSPIEHEAHVLHVDEMVGLLLQNLDLGEEARDRMRRRTSLVSRFDAAQVSQATRDRARFPGEDETPLGLPLTDLVPQPRRTA